MFFFCDAPRKKKRHTNARDNRHPCARPRARPSRPQSETPKTPQRDPQDPQARHPNETIETTDTTWRDCFKKLRDPGDYLARLFLKWRDPLAMSTTDCFDCFSDPSRDAGVIFFSNHVACGICRVLYFRRRPPSVTRLWLDLDFCRSRSRYRLRCRHSVVYLAHCPCASPLRLCA